MPFRLVCVPFVTVLLATRAAAAQTPPEQPPPPPPAAHQHEHMASGGWQYMQDGVAFLTLNRQGRPRGETDVRSQNWYMGMGMRSIAAGTFAITGMFSLEPATVTPRGYSEIFQVGEAYKKLENIDRQHPHDLFMQLAASYRLPLGDLAGVTIAGGPVGEPALGPVAFMHRPSATENPTAPLSHHTFDSTHIAQGVVTAAFDAGPLLFEGSAFHGREPDEHRWNLETHKLDSWSTRLSFRPSDEWFAQVSYGFLKEPEALEPGNQRRVSGSVGWLRQNGTDFTAATALAGHVTRRFTDVTALMLEATHQVGKNAVFGRAERLQVETEHLLFPQIVHVPHPGELLHWMTEVTLGGARSLGTAGGLDIGLGGDVQFYWVPPRPPGLLSLVDTHGAHPVSFHIFLRVRPSADSTPRMWNMTMAQPMGHPR